MERYKIVTTSGASTTWTTSSNWGNWFEYVAVYEPKKDAAKKEPMTLMKAIKKFNRKLNER